MPKKNGSPLVIAAAVRHSQFMFPLRAQPLIRFVLLGLMLAGATGPSSGAPTQTSDFMMDVWTSDDDLPDSSVTAITQTPDGYLWIGTLNGLARFDGIRFTHFDPLTTPALKHARIQGGGLFLGRAGTLWINTYDGSMTSLRDGVFTHEWQGGQVSAVFSQSHLTYFALLRGGLIYRDANAPGNTNWQTIALPGATLGTTFRQDSAGNLWFLTREEVVGRVRGTNCEPVRLEELGLTSSTAKYLSADRHGSIWLCTDREIARWNGQRFDNLTPTNGPAFTNAAFVYSGDGQTYWVLADGVVRQAQERQWVGEAMAWRELATANRAFLSTHVDQRERVWLRSFGQGLFHTTGDGTPRRMTAAQGLPNNRVSCWFEDHEGNLWLGVDRGGLVRLREKRFHVIGAAQGIAVPAVSSVCEDPEGNIWFGTFGGGLYRWKEDRLDHFTLTNEVNPRAFFSVAPGRDHQLWVSAGNEDLYRLTQGGAQTGSLLHGVKAILVDRTGAVWLGRPNGLVRLAGTNWTYFSALGELERIEVRALAEDRLGRIWIGGGNGQLYQYDNGEFTRFQATDELAGQAIWSLHPDDDGTLWVGTFRGGLLRFKNGNFTRFTTRNGLPSDVICQILDDGRGRLWIGSHKGLFHIAKEALHQPDAKESSAVPCGSYGLFDGLPTLEFTGNYQPTCWRGSDGRLWFATVKGLVSVHPDDIAPNSLPPPVVIETVQLDGRPWTNYSRRTPATLELPPGKHRLNFHFTALSFAAPDKVRFRYRLLGFETDWVEAGGQRSAHYGPVPPGQYRFQVVACNNDGIWSDGASIELKQLPQFWQTWWFQGLGTVAVLGTIFGTVRFTTTRRLRRKLEQLRHQRAIAHERERIARDIHDDLGAGLTQILLQSSLARRDAEGQVQTDFTQIADTARELVRTMDEIVWAINPENDTLDGLVTYLGKFVAEFVSAAGKRCRVQVPPQLPAHSLSAEARHNLYLAVKEALHNAVKHSNAREISFQLLIRPDAFTFVIKDDGGGFDPAPTVPATADESRLAPGQGLRHIGQRLTAIGGTGVIRSEPGTGTTVELTLPFNKTRKLPP
jgi:signal transduction histidine kinase/ligand-binding sensor domain-containing protein